MILLRRFARTVDDLGSALAQRAVMIELRKAQILKGSFLELQKRVVDRAFACSDRL